MENKIKFEALLTINGIRQSVFVDANTKDEAIEKIEELYKDRQYKLVYIVSTPMLGTASKPAKAKVEPAAKVVEEVPTEAPAEEEAPTGAVEAPVVTEAEEAEATEVVEAPAEPEVVEEAPKAKPRAKKSTKA